VAHVSRKKLVESFHIWSQMHLCTRKSPTKFRELSGSAVLIRSPKSGLDSPWSTLSQRCRFISFSADRRSVIASCNDRHQWLICRLLVSRWHLAAYQLLRPLSRSLTSLASFLSDSDLTPSVVVATAPASPRLASASCFLFRSNTVWNRSRRLSTKPSAWTRTLQQ